MDYFATSGAASRQRAACAVACVYEEAPLPPGTAALDEASGKRISRLVSAGDFAGKPGTSLLLTELDGVACERILLVGCGKPDKFDLKTYRRAVATAAAALKNTGVTNALSFLGADRPDVIDAHALGLHGALAIETGLYRFDQLKSGRKPKPPALKRFGFGVAARGDRNRALAGAVEGAAIADGVRLARDLGNLPANVCTPTYLARTARGIAKGHGALTVSVLSEAEIKKHKMGAFLSVTAGSDQPARFIVMRYRGAPASRRPVVLVGKGITFDTGGISLKPPPSMDEMKFDMCGAAAVIGTMQSLVRLRLPINVVALVPTCENMPGGDATKPGDIVRSMSGKTIEILNTDAEGRLILCDALTYAARFKPAVVVDVATLTGACVIALGEHYSGLFSNDDELADALVAAGTATDDPAWRMPVGEDYAKQLDSNFADFANVGGREGGSCTAASFLAKFVEDQRWAHLDIAGTAWQGGKAKGASGRPVPLLVRFLIDQA